MKPETRHSILGKVASRQCPLCGHHEIGFVTDNGEFHPLRPGTSVRLDMPVPASPTSLHTKEALGQEAEEEAQYRVWIPEPLRGDAPLRRKYGVLIKERLLRETLSGGRYELAYLEKLERLIETSLDVPLPVTLDRFFNAPHLASGNPRQIAEAMIRELDEIQRPALLVGKWLERKDERSLADLVAPRSLKDLGSEAVEDAQIKRELQTLTLEEFLGML